MTLLVLRMGNLFRFCRDDRQDYVRGILCVMKDGLAGNPHLAVHPEGMTRIADGPPRSELVKRDEREFANDMFQAEFA